MGTSSARPESLVAYTAHTLPHLDEAMRRIEGIDEVALMLRATSGGYIPMASWARLELELAATIDGVRRVDEWVADVGHAFTEADESGGTDGVLTADDEALLRHADMPTWLLDFLLPDLLNVWSGRGDYFPYVKSVLGTLHVKMALEWLGYAKAERLANRPPLGPVGWAIHAHDKFPSYNNKFAARTFIKKVPGSPLAEYLQKPAATAAMRKIGIAGGVYSTITDVRNVVDQGNMAEAYEREGAGYVADLARTGFSMTSTAFLVAPNPGTAGAMLATGVVWAGAEAWDHWGDDVSSFVDDQWDAGWEATGNAAEAVGDRASETWEGATGRVSDAWDGAADAAETIGTVASTLTDKLPSFSW